MKRKTIACILAMVLLCGMLPSAFADSILPSLETVAAAEAAVNYGMRMNTAPTSTATLSDGSYQEVYSGVTEEDYNNFGSILGELEYSVASVETTETGVELELQKGNFPVMLSYDLTAGKLTMQYPEGTQVEQPKPYDPFEGYVRFTIGDTVKIAGLGEVTISDVHLNDNIAVNKSTNTYDHSTLESLAWLEGNFKNIRNEKFKISSLAVINLVYINSDNVYTYGLCNGDQYFSERYNDPIYNSKAIGKLSTDGKGIYCSDNGFYSFTVNPLETIHFAAGFYQVPDEVVTSKEGTLAITFKFDGCDQDYVLVLHEN